MQRSTVGALTAARMDAIEEILSYEMRHDAELRLRLPYCNHAPISSMCFSCLSLPTRVKELIASSSCADI